MEGLTELLANVLNKCQQRGMPLPYLLVAVAINGSIMGARYVQHGGRGLDAEFLVEHTVDDMMMLPMNIMIVDAKGEAVRVLITKEGVTFH